jgi:branched-chain amino acid transport system permease protein
MKTWRDQWWVGVLGVLLITAPFLWLKLNYNYAEGSVALAPNLAKGWSFFYNLLPIAILVVTLIGATWALQRWVLPWIDFTAWNQALPVWSKTGTGQGILLAVMIGSMLFLPTTHLQNALFVCFYMLLALGLNIAVGFTGILVLGYVAFYALGGYAFAITQQHVSWLTWWMALPFAFILGAVVGWLVGLPCLRLRGDYLAIVTLGFGESFREITRNLPKLTNGDKGITLPPSAKILPLPGLTALQSAFLVSAVFVAITALAIHRIYRSRVGRAWIAIREDEVAAAAMGISVVKMKLLAFSLSAAIAAMAGVLRVGYTGFINPAIADFQESVIVLAMVILGGLGSIPGVLLGAALLFLIPAWLRNQDMFASLPDYRLLLFGVIMVVVMLLRPQGLLGSSRHQHELTKS